MKTAQEMFKVLYAEPSEPEGWFLVAVDLLSDYEPDYGELVYSNTNNPWQILSGGYLTFDLRSIGRRIYFMGSNQTSRQINVGDVFYTLNPTIRRWP